MNIAMKLTLDGLVRALRWKAHGLAEEVEQGYRRRRPDKKQPPAGRGKMPTRLAKEERA